MATKILVLGDPGTGKTTAAETLNPAEVFFICSDKKGLPFKGWKNQYKTIYDSTNKVDLSKSNYYSTSSPTDIKYLLNTINDSKPEIKVIIIDTITAIMEDSYMAKAKEPGFGKFTDLALDVFNIFTTYVDQLREDLTVIILSHTEDNYDAEGTLKSTFKVVGGKLIGQNIKPEARFNIVLHSEVVMANDKPNYFFLTQNNGKKVARSPKGMFTELKIANDYQKIIETIKEYES